MKRHKANETKQKNTKETNTTFYIYGQCQIQGVTRVLFILVRV